MLCMAHGCSLQRAAGLAPGRALLQRLPPQACLCSTDGSGSPVNQSICGCCSLWTCHAPSFAALSSPGHLQPLLLSPPPAGPDGGSLQVLDITKADTCLTLTSGGCNALNLIVHGAGKVHAVDCNPAQSSLLELKATAIR